MSKKYSLDSFISDIERIALHGGTVTQSEVDDCDEEYKELLLLAELLAKVNYTAKSQGRVEKVMAEMISNAREDDELEDDELDMVAGGRNLNEMPDGKKNKD
ncbi:MAG: hypothetical protein JL50_02495 [Peptococcaceae bacterium BICA1-7]|nr:MAG: hypothetical protein JL50_02495 [Peptococcaceae bacterium BICA1-7]HBV99463.1 hypothetical protein [Desulfotomaculum sp.]